ncbi:hypothetical protein ABT369_38780 [Dactylosporangium sp. NPDC000244]|uniref:hypothetical protein n=1 Tax=Dactylosporangium sp. NPDC000244 TaxID=3154365 RepID=UPI003324DB6C
MPNPRPLCAVDPCTIPNRHLDSCEQRDTCKGCLPGLAADGLLLCTHHARRIGRDALTLAARHRQLALVLAGTGQPGGERTTGGDRNPNVNLNLRAAAIRRDIEQLLTRLARLITSQRGFAWPTDTATVVTERPYGFIGPMPARLVARHTFRVAPLARLVARSADWLAADSRAAEHATQLAELARQAFRTAYPTGTRAFELPGLDGERYLACPNQIPDEDRDGETKPCPGNLWTIMRRDGDRLPAQIMCNHDDEHQWPASQWIKLGKRMIKHVTEATGAKPEDPGYGYSTVEEIMRTYSITKAYIYKLASTKGWGRYRHPDGGVRYRRDDVAATLAGCAGQG